MTDPKRTQSNPEQSRREAEGQRRTGETERKGERNPMPHEEGEPRSQRESRRL